jgi:hypothetical protein
MKLSCRAGIAVLATVVILALVGMACGEEEEAAEGPPEGRTPVTTPTMAPSPTMAPTPELQQQRVIEGINALLKLQAEALMSADWASSYAYFADQCREMASLEEHRTTFELIRTSALQVGITSFESSVIKVSSIQGNRAIVDIDLVAKSDGMVIEEYSGTVPGSEYVLERGTWKDANCESIALGP